MEHHPRRRLYLGRLVHGIFDNPRRLRVGLGLEDRGHGDGGLHLMHGGAAVGPDQLHRFVGFPLPGQTGGVAHPRDQILGLGRFVWSFFGIAGIFQGLLLRLGELTGQSLRQGQLLLLGQPEAQFPDGP